MNLTADEALVARLLAAVGGEVPMTEAIRLLAPDVICHMDRYTVRGASEWVDWVEFIRSRGVENLKAHVDRYVTGADGTITAFGSLSGGFEGASVAHDGHARGGTARYRVVDGKIVEIWTSRWNYEKIFGAKVRHPLSWLLVLLWMAVRRRLPWRRRVLMSDMRGGLSDGGGDQSRRRGPAHDHLER